MERFYLIDFENVHDDGLKNINTLTKSDHVHIFFTKNANRVGLGILHATEAHIDSHEVPAGKQSLDMHLASYLGYLLGKSKEGTCSYIIVSKDKDYDNIIAFWREKGIKSISREEKIPGSNVVSQKKTTMPVATTTTKQTINSNPNTGKANTKSSVSRHELQVRSFFGQHFKKKIRIEKREDIIKIVLGAKTRQQVNSKLMKLYRNGDQVKEIIEVLRPLIKDLPGK